MGKWWIGAVLTMGCLGASAANAQDIPFPAVQGLQGAPGGPPPAPTYATPPDPPVAPAVGPGSERGFDNAFDPPPECLPPPRFHADFDYLAWWTKHSGLPTLVTQGSALDAIPGALGQPNTTPLITGNVDDAFHSGGRLTLSYDLCEDHAWMVQGSGFILQHRVSTDTVTSTNITGNTVIARPFFNFQTNQEDAVLVAQAGVQSGTVAVQQSQSIYGGEANVAWNCWSHDDYSVSGSLLVGGRYLEMRESLAIQQNTLGLAGGANPGASTVSVENFTTRNEFYGGQVGAEYSYVFGPITCQLIGKVAAGPIEQTVQINAASQTTQADGTIARTSNNGVLVQASNAGSFVKRTYAVIPEIAANGSYAFNDHVRVGAGYDYLFWSRVLRPADLIDTGAANLGTLARPAVPVHETSFWMQGLNVTLEISF